MTRGISIPILGRPVAEKATFLFQIARAFQAEKSAYECPVRWSTGESVLTRLWACQFQWEEIPVEF